jgi:hypothetical protein
MIQNIFVNLKLETSIIQIKMENLDKFRLLNYEILSKLIKKFL